MTLYRHFRSKDVLIAAYLEHSNAEFMAWLEGAIETVDDPQAKLVAASTLSAGSRRVRAASAAPSRARRPNFPEMDHPGHRVALEHKRAVLERFAGLAREA